MNPLTMTSEELAAHNVIVVFKSGNKISISGKEVTINADKITIAAGNYEWWTIQNIIFIPKEKQEVFDTRKTGV